MNSLYTSLKNNTRFIYEDGLFYQSDFNRNNSFEENYLTLRKKEGRLYGDQVARLLPEFNGQSDLSAEWKMRKQSARRLISHLQQRTHHQIMEIGCGNGWLIRYLQDHVPAEYLGVDINEYELKQAVRISDNRPSCFLYGDINSDALNGMHADTIVIASAAHYFPDLKLFIKKLLTLLSPGGEIHIIDTPFYREANINEAKLRSEKYFRKMEAPLNGVNYHHHSLIALEPFDYKVAYWPHSFINRLKQRFLADSPFPWIIVTDQNR